MKFSEHRYAMRGFGADADELFFSLADYARNPSQKQVLKNSQTFDVQNLLNTFISARYSQN